MKTTLLSLLFLGSFIPAVTANDTLATADRLSASGLLSGYSIERAGDNDYLRVVIPSAGDFTVNTEGTTDTFGYLLNASGAQLAVNDDSPTSLNFSISQRLAAGTHYVRIRHFSPTGTGAYQIRSRFVPVVDDHGNTTATATALTLSGTATTSLAGHIERAGDEDFFRVTVSGNGFLDAGTTGTTDTYGFLLNGTGTQIAANDDANGSSNFAIRQAVTTGTYFVKIRHYSATSTGAYTLNVRFEAAAPPPPPPTAGNRALVIGISDYQSISDLNYCDDDARDVSAALRTAGWNVTTLIDSQATKAAIRDNISRLAPGGGKFLLYYSGHGSASGTTGYLCNWDTSTLASMISDTELNTWLAAAGSSTAVGAIMDSCFAGSFIGRSAQPQGIKTRFYQVPGAPPADPRAGEFLARNISTGTRVALTACAGSQFSVEHATWGHGWFTWRLLSIWRASASDVNRNSWISIEESYTPIAGGYNYGSGRQDPQLYDGNGAAHFDLTRL